MPISFKSKLSSQIANATFLDKTIDDLKKGKLHLYKTTPSDADAITDVQEYINKIANAVGVIGEFDTEENVYQQENYIANGDSYKEAIDVLDIVMFEHYQEIQQNAQNIIPNTRVVDTQSIDDDGVLFLDQLAHRQFFNVSGNAAAVTMNLLPFTDTNIPQDCSTITLIGNDDTNTVTLQFNDVDYGLLINGNATLGRGHMLTLIYNQNLLRYIEQSRNF